jgi:hypothetical protein
LKVTTAILFFIIILLQTFSSFVIRANYLLNKDYIAKVLCINREKPQMHCNGKCYLAKKLKEQERQEQQSPNPKLEKFEVQLFFIAETFNQTPIQRLSRIEYMIQHEKTLASFPRSVFHPPTV